MRRPLLIAILALGLSACGEDDSVTGSDASASSSSSSGRFAVVDTVVGTWKVSSKDAAYAGYTVQISKDSLIWEKTAIKTLRPTANGLRFYAHGGRMGLTNGQTATDNVTFEYFMKGDTLWMEYQFTADPDGKLDRTSQFSHALLPAP